MLERELIVAREAGARAAGILRHHFENGVERQHKASGEPVTAADMESDRAISEILRAAFPQDGLLTEESDDSRDRLEAERVWIVDPLDGTLDFVSASPEFAVHIALVSEGRPILSVIENPMARLSYFAVRGEGAYLETSDGARTRLKTAIGGESFRVVTSRLRRSERLEQMLSRLPDCERLYCGSSGLKASMVASGACELYFAATSKMKEWDLCAPHLIVEEAGGRCTDLFGGALAYNRPDVRALKGLCITCGPLHEDVLAALGPVARSFPWFRDVT